MSLAYDTNVHTVCVQSVTLAEQLANAATTEHWLASDLESLLLTD
jgi:hypothetical protein